MTVSALDSSILADFMDFSCNYSSNLPKILKALNISLAFSSYQTGRVMIVRSDGNNIDVNFKKFKRPMGLVSTENSLTIGTFTEVVNFQREEGLVEKIKTSLQPIEQDITAPKLPSETPESTKVQTDRVDPKPTTQPDTDDFTNYQKSLYDPVDSRVDACYIARSAHYSGMINIHDIDWGNDGLWAVNSSFSCLCTLEPDFSFVPRWKPHFISELKPEDRCHLNGMALKNGEPAYVTAFSQYDDASAWRTGDKTQGILMDVEYNDILLNGLVMPHSPRWHNNNIYFCNSGYGHFCSYSPSSNDYQVIAELPGFTRGVDFIGDIALVGTSKVRKSNISNPAPIAEMNKDTYSGIWLIDLTENKTVGYIKFTGNVEQIYDIAILPDCVFPELIEPDHPRMRNHFCHPTLQPLR